MNVQKLDSKNKVSSYINFPIKKSGKVLSEEEGFISPDRVQVSSIGSGERVDDLSTLVKLSRYLEKEKKSERQELKSVYQKILDHDPISSPSPKEVELVKKFAPQIYVNPREYFGLKDLMVIVHPDKPLIGYHLIWEDDIDFPDDQEPSDHEIVWVEYNPDNSQIKDVYTYWHGSILHSPDAVKDAQANGQHPRIFIQWGKHGSLPVGWKNLIFPHKRNVVLGQDLEGLSFPELKKGIRCPDHPVARDWPKKFYGNLNDFTDFSQYIDISSFLNKKGRIIKSRWPNAVLGVTIPYNTCPKSEWPLGVKEKEKQELSRIQARKIVENENMYSQLQAFIAKLPEMDAPASMKEEVKKGLLSIIKNMRDLEKTDLNVVNLFLNFTMEKVNRFKELRKEGKSFSDALKETQLTSKVPNFGIIQEGVLVRGAQPTSEGLRWLKKMGVKTIINLREKGVEDKYSYSSFNRKDEKEQSQKLGMNYFEISVKDHSVPTKEQIRRFLSIVEDPANQPVFIHCKAGIGRTGIMAAAWMMKNAFPLDKVMEVANRFGLRGDSDHYWQKHFIKEQEKWLIPKT